MDRREFLTAKPKPRLKQPGSPDKSYRVLAGIAPYTGPWGSAEVAHLLKRTMFGVSKSYIDYFKEKSLSESVEELINPTSPLPSSPVKDYIDTGATVPDTNIAPGSTWVNDPNTDGTITSRRRSSFKKWWMGVMIHQDKSIREKITLFWHNHFATEMNDVGDSQYIYKHHNLLRANSLGNFKELVKAVTIDACMLRYLNGYNNQRTAPDENYARELQELFTLGKENETNYTEGDVKAAARVLTGWQIRSSTISSYFTLSRHDITNKQFSSFYGNTVITGRNNANAGMLELDDLINMIFTKREEISRFIVRKLYRWFCYYTIDAATEANVIEPLAQIFRDNDWEIKPVLSALFQSEHFFDELNRGCLIKSPVDLVVGLCHEFGLSFPDVNSDYVNAYGFWENIRSQASIMTQDIGDPRDVAGWPSYYQEPQYHEIWINADTLPKRNRFTDLMILTGYTRSGKTLRIDPVAFAKTLVNPANPNDLINGSLAILFTVPISEESKLSIKKQILLTGQEDDKYWTDAWIAYVANPTNNTAYQTVLTRLRNLYKYFMNMAEYQLS